MLHERFGERVGEGLTSREAWRPFARAGERGFWNALPTRIRQGCLQHGEEAVATPWPHLPATLFMDFVRTGNRARYQDVNAIRRATVLHLALAECCEGRGRFLDPLVDALWSTCEETWWGYPAHTYVQKAGGELPDADEPVVDLFVAETASLLAWTAYLLGESLDSVSPYVTRRIQREIQRKILDPCLARDDFWWMGWKADHVNNWNPWINSNWLSCTLLMEPDPARRAATVRKILRSLDNFLNSYPPDGGCDEGPGYWQRAGLSLFDCLELLYSATGGAVDAYDEPLVADIGRYVVRAHIADDWMVNFADAPPIVRPPGSLVYAYGRRIGDADLQAFGAWEARRAGIEEAGPTDSLHRRLQGLSVLDEVLAADPHPPLLGDVYLPDTGVFAARSRAGEVSGLYLAAKGGHNAESHNHNDVGHFIVYRDGRPLLIDVGVEEYTAQTFSARRYEIWTMQSAWHNLPTIDGHMQQPGRDRCARDLRRTADDAHALFSLDIAPAWSPDVGVTSWVRTFTLDRAGEGAVDVEDRFELAREGQSLVLSLVTASIPTLADDGTISLAARALPASRRTAAGTVRFDPAALTAAIEEQPVTDRRLTPVWGDRIWRILLTATAPARTGTLRLRIEA